MLFPQQRMREVASGLRLDKLRDAIQHRIGNVDVTSCINRDELARANDSCRGVTICCRVRPDIPWPADKRRIWR